MTHAFHPAGPEDDTRPISGAFHEWFRHSPATDAALTTRRARRHAWRFARPSGCRCLRLQAGQPARPP
ncbi:hypothetical protein PT2222_200170 [Paraburkholderia tropica]